MDVSAWDSLDGLALPVFNRLFLGKFSGCQIAEGRISPVSVVFVLQIFQRATDFGQKGNQHLIYAFAAPLAVEIPND